MDPRGQKTKARDGKSGSGSPTSKLSSSNSPLNKPRPKRPLRGREMVPSQTKTAKKKFIRSTSEQNRPVYVVKTSYTKPRKHAQASGRTKNGKLKIQSSSSDSLCDTSTNQQLRYQSIDTPSLSSSDECISKSPNRPKKECEEVSRPKKKEASGQTKIYSKPPNAPSKRGTKKPKMNSSYSTTTDQQLQIDSQKVMTENNNRRGYERNCSDEESQQVKISAVEACIEDMSGNSRNIRNLSNNELLAPRPVMPNRAYLPSKTFADPCLEENEDFRYEAPPMVIVPDHCTKAIGQVDVDCIKRTTCPGISLPATTFTVERPTCVRSEPVICKDKIEENKFDEKRKQELKKLNERMTDSFKPLIKPKEQLATTSKYKPPKPDLSREDASPSPLLTPESKKRKIKKPIPSVKKPITPAESSTNTFSKSGVKQASKPVSRTASKIASKTASKTDSKLSSKTSLRKPIPRGRHKKRSGWNPKDWTTDQKILYGTIGATILVILGGLGLYYAEIIDFEFLD